MRQPNSMENCEIAKQIVFFMYFWLATLAQWTRQITLIIRSMMNFRCTYSVHNILKQFSLFRSMIFDANAILLCLSYQILWYKP